MLNYSVAELRQNSYGFKCFAKLTLNKYTAKQYRLFLIKNLRGRALYVHRMHALPNEQHLKGYVEQP